jgi:predicted negative regulator of RcsB-dependent stress response
MPSTTATPATAPVRDESPTPFEWIQLHSRALTIVLVAGIAVGAAYALWKRSGAIKEDRAEKAYFQALRAVQSGNAPVAAQELDRLVTRYAGTSAATQAAMTLATIRFRDGKHAEGIQVLEKLKAEGVPESFEASIEALVAAGLADQGKFDDAAARYRVAAGKAQFPADRDSFLAEAARSLMSANKRPEALAIWSSLASDPDSPQIAEARVRVGELTAKPSGK